jgi:hypothetical protein
MWYHMIGNSQQKSAKHHNVQGHVIPEFRLIKRTSTNKEFNWFSCFKPRWMNIMDPGGLYL